MNYFFDYIDFKELKGSEFNSDEFNEAIIKYMNFDHPDLIVESKLGFEKFTYKIIADSSSEAINMYDVKGYSFLETDNDLSMVSISSSYTSFLKLVDILEKDCYGNKGKEELENIFNEEFQDKINNSLKELKSVNFYNYDLIIILGDRGDFVQPFENRKNLKEANFAEMNPEYNSQFVLNIKNESELINILEKHGHELPEKTIFLNHSEFFTLHSNYESINIPLELRSEKICEFIDFDITREIKNEKIKERDKMEEKFKDFFLKTKTKEDALEKYNIVSLLDAVKSKDILNEKLFVIIPSDELLKECQDLSSKNENIVICNESNTDLVIKGASKEKDVVVINLKDDLYVEGQHSILVYNMTNLRDISKQNLIEGLFEKSDKKEVLDYIHDIEVESYR